MNRTFTTYLLLALYAFSFVCCRPTHHSNFDDAERAEARSITAAIVNSRSTYKVVKDQQWNSPLLTFNTTSTVASQATSLKVNGSCEPIRLYQETINPTMTFGNLTSGSNTKHSFIVFFDPATRSFKQQFSSKAMYETTCRIVITDVDGASTTLSGIRVSLISNENIYLSTVSLATRVNMSNPIPFNVTMTSATKDSAVYPKNATFTVALVDTWYGDVKASFQTQPRLLTWTQVFPGGLYYYSNYTGYSITVGRNVSISTAPHVLQIWLNDLTSLQATSPQFYLY